jgi:hypothetical protein
MVVNANNDSTLLHQHLGHANFGSLQHMTGIQMIEDLPQIEPHSGVCEGCILGKHHQESFLKVRHVSKLVAMVHSDICWSMTTQSLRGAKYLFNFIDDFSHLGLYSSIQGCFLKFKDFKLLVKN